MANGNMPKSHARVRLLLERRRDILVHPSNALTDDAANAAVPHHYYRPGELLVRNDAGQVDAFERVATSSGWRYRRREDHGRPKLRGKGLRAGQPAASRRPLSRSPRRTPRRCAAPAGRPLSRRFRGVRRTTYCSDWRSGGWTLTATPVDRKRTKRPSWQAMARASPSPSSTPVSLVGTKEPAPGGERRDLALRGGALGLRRARRQCWPPPRAMGPSWPGWSARRRSTPT